MGILLEADYKGVISGKESISSGLRRAFSEKKGGGRVSGSGNPLERREPGEGLEPDEGDGQITYELMNRDSGMEWQCCCIAGGDGSMVNWRLTD